MLLCLRAMGAITEVGSVSRQVAVSEGQAAAAERRMKRPQQGAIARRATATYVTSTLVVLVVGAGRGRRHGL